MDIEGAGGFIRNDGGEIFTTPANLVANRIHIKKGQPYSFLDRPFMMPIFDDPHDQIGLMTARQISKCVSLSSRILMVDGSTNLAQDVLVGDEIACLEMPLGANAAAKCVTWKSDTIVKKALRITTRLGHVACLADTHPVRVWNGWVCAGMLRVGDRVASLRKSGCFFDDADVDDNRIRLTAYMLGDGHIGQRYFAFCQIPGEVLNEFLIDLTNIGCEYTTTQKKDNKAVDIKIRKRDALKTWFDDDGITDTRSHNKFFPSWVFRLNRSQTAMFINRLWSTDGWVTKPRPSQYSIGYCTTSKVMAQQLQALLWKFGIQSSKKSYIPKKGRRYWNVRIETLDGITAFLSEVGAKGKGFGVNTPSDDVFRNNNRDTLPIEIRELLSSICISAGHVGKNVPNDNSSLHSVGLRKTPGYPPTRTKLARYVKHFRDHEQFNQKLVDDLNAHMIGDVAWDKIESIEDIGEIECVDFEVSDHHNFIADGIVTHNSTTLAADSIIRCESLAPYTSLMVTPSQDQTRKFSHDRLGPTIETSPAVRAQVTTDQLSSVLEKEFISGSKIYLSYAKDNPDRARGITADELKLDEVQDMILSLVEPVLSESMFTSRHQRTWWSGTPKSHSNGIEQRVWRQSDQREWMVRCWHCTNASGLPFHQKLTMDNVKGGTGPVCKKCERLLDTLDGQWVITSTKTEHGKEPRIHGYHIPQIIFPTRSVELAPGQFGFLNWQKFMDDINNPEYDEATILNEKFGESADSEDRPVKEEELMAMCDPAQTMPLQYESWMQGTHTFAGVDWGYGLKSSTVLVIGQFDPRNTDKFQYLFMKKYSGRDADPKTCMPDILYLMQHFRAHRCHADFGAGFGMNSQIIDARGEDFLTTNYWASGIKGKKMKFNVDMNAYVLNRSAHLSRFFQAIKRHQMFCHFRWEDFRPFAREVMNVFREERKNGDMYYDHKPEEPDDSMHAMIYCWLIASIYKFGKEGVEKVSGTEHDVFRD